MRHALSWIMIVLVAIGMILLGAVWFREGAEGMDIASGNHLAGQVSIAYKKSVAGLFLALGGGAVLYIQLRVAESTLTLIVRKKRKVWGRRIAPAVRWWTQRRRQKLSPAVTPPPPSPAPRPLGTPQYLVPARNVKNQAEQAPPRAKKRGGGTAKNAEESIPTHPRPNKKEETLPARHLLLQNKISSFVPDGLDISTIAITLFWGFGLHRGRPFFGKHYLPIEKVKSNACRKGCRSEEVEKCLKWLMAVRIVIIPKRGIQGKIFCSLNPDHGSVKEPWGEIIKALVVTSRDMQRRN